LPSRRCVLVVDDDPSMRMCIKRMLTEHGFETTLFESADALLVHGDFDGACCVVLDINLNGESGFALRRRLVENGVSLPVIYITGSDSEASRAAALESGCIAYLTKPFATKALIESIALVARPTIT